MCLAVNSLPPFLPSSLPLPQLFGFMGFAVSVVWIYITANEIVNLLQVWLDAAVGGSVRECLCLCLCLCV